MATKKKTKPKRKTNSKPKSRGRKARPKSGGRSKPKRRSNPRSGSRSKPKTKRRRRNPRVTVNAGPKEIGAFAATYVGLDYIAAVALDMASRFGLVGSGLKAALGIGAGFGLSKTKWGKKNRGVCLAIGFAGLAQGLGTLSSWLVSKAPKPEKPLLNLSKTKASDEVDQLASELDNREGVAEADYYRPTVGEIDYSREDLRGISEDAMAMSMPGHWSADLPGHLPGHWGS